MFWINFIFHFFFIGSWYKEAHLEMDVNSKSDRVEWGHARYQPIYRCDQAYEIIAHWVAASGSVVADLV